MEEDNIIKSFRCECCNCQYQQTSFTNSEFCESCINIRRDLVLWNFNPDIMSTDWIKISWKVINPEPNRFNGGAFRAYLLKIITDDDIIDSQLNIDLTNLKLRYYFCSDDRAKITKARIIRNK